MVEIDQNTELVTAKTRDHVIVAAGGVLDAGGDRLEQLIPRIVTQAVIDALEVVNVEEHHGQLAVPCGAITEFFSK